MGLRAVVLLLAATSAACATLPPYACHLPFGHPSMSTADVASRIDVRVRSVTEGASGDPGPRAE